MKLFTHGCTPTPPREREKLDAALCASQGGVLFSDLAPELKDTGKGKLSTPYKSVVKFCPYAFTDDFQEEGDCTSHGSRNAADITRAVEIDIKGEPESWEARGATEVIYDYRGHSGEGMNAGRATEFLTKYGIILRKKYPELGIDLTTYKPTHKRNWRGTDPKILAECAKHPARYKARLRTTGEVRDALANGYGCHIGSLFGTNRNNKRDKIGMVPYDDRWSHDMCIGACDDTRTLYPEALYLLLQSWGIWITGGMPEWGPIPGGSIVIPESVLAKMLPQMGYECWCVGDVQGFPARKLPTYGAETYL